MATFKKDLYRGTEMTRGIIRPSEDRARRVWHVKDLSSTGRSGLNEAITRAKLSSGNFHPDQPFLPLRRITARAVTDGQALCILDYSRVGGSTATTDNADKLASTRVRKINMNWWATQFGAPLGTTLDAPPDTADINLVYDYRSEQMVPAPMRSEVSLMDVLVDTVLTESPMSSVNVRNMLTGVNNNTFPLLGYEFPARTLKFNPPIVRTVPGDFSTYTFYTTYQWTYRPDGWYYSFPASATTAKKRLMYPSVAYVQPPYEAAP